LKRLSIERNKIKPNQIQRQPKYIRDNALYKNNQQRYIKQIHNSQNRIEEDINKRVLSLGVVGEQVGSISARKIAKGNSLDMRLPKIGEGAAKGKDKLGRRNQNSIDSLKLPTLGKYRHGMYYLKNPKILNQKIPSKILLNFLKRLNYLRKFNNYNLNKFLSLFLCFYC